MNKKQQKEAAEKLYSGITDAVRPVVEELLATEHADDDEESYATSEEFEAFKTDVTERLDAIENPEEEEGEEEEAVEVAGGDIVEAVLEAIENADDFPGFKKALEKSLSKLVQ